MREIFMDNEEKLMVIDEFGNEVEAKLLNIIEVDGNEYLLYYTNASEDEKNIYAMKIVKNSVGEEDLEVITDEREKQMIKEVIDKLTDE